MPTWFVIDPDTEQPTGVVQGDDSRQALLAAQRLGLLVKPAAYAVEACVWPALKKRQQERETRH